MEPQPDGVNEKWITGYENLYSITRDGMIYSFKWNKKKKLKPSNNRGYLFINLWNEHGQKRYQHHRLIALHFIPNDKPDTSIQVDHIDGNRQNNSISNLRWVTNSQNQFNRTKQNGTTSKYKGVSWNTQNKKWHVRIKFNNKTIHIGYFDTETDSARAYDCLASSLFGEFAKLNFPK